MTTAKEPRRTAYKNAKAEMYRWTINMVDDLHSKSIFTSEEKLALSYIHAELTALSNGGKIK